MPKSLKKRVEDLESRMLNNEKERAHILTTLDEMKKVGARKIDNLSKRVEKFNTTVTGSFKELDRSVKEINETLKTSSGSD